MDNTLLDMLNSSYPTKLESLIANYFFAFMRIRDPWDICNVTWFLRGQTMNKICQYEFVYSVNTRRRFNSQDVQFEFRQVLRQHYMLKR